MSVIVRPTSTEASVLDIQYTTPEGQQQRVWRTYAEVQDLHCAVTRLCGENQHLAVPLSPHSSQLFFEDVLSNPTLRLHQAVVVFFGPGGRNNSPRMVDDSDAEVIGFSDDESDGDSSDDELEVSFHQPIGEEEDEGAEVGQEEEEEGDDGKEEHHQDDGTAGGQVDEGASRLDDVPPSPLPPPPRTPPGQASPVATPPCVLAVRAQEAMATHETADTSPIGAIPLTTPPLTPGAGAGGDTDSDGWTECDVSMAQVLSPDDSIKQRQHHLRLHCRSDSNGSGSSDGSWVDVGSELVEMK